MIDAAESVLHAKKPVSSGGIAGFDFSLLVWSDSAGRGLVLVFSVLLTPFCCIAVSDSDGYGPKDCVLLIQSVSPLSASVYCPDVPNVIRRKKTRS